MRPSRPLPRLALLAPLVCACAGLLLAPATAGAHASLLASQPGDHQVVPVAPSVVRMTFDERIRVLPDGIKVFAPSGARVDQGAPTVSGHVVTERIAGQGAGTYAVAWRVISQDGHEVSATLAFHVGAAAGSAAIEHGKAATRSDRTTLVVFGIARFFLLLALLVAVGGALFAIVVAPGWRPLWLLRSLVLLLLAAGVAYVCDAALARAVPLDRALTASALTDEMGNPFGRAMLLLAGCAILACGSALSLAVRDARPSVFARLVAAVLFVGLATTLSLSGHAQAARPMALRVSLDVVHVLAAALWVGGLVQLRAMARNAPQHLATIRRFSTLAVVAVFVLFATGAYATFDELGLHPATLLDSQYGRIVFAKLLLFAGTMPLAFLNRSASVPAIVRRPGQASALLRQYVYRELLLLLTIIGLTAWLVRSAPGR